MKYAYLASRNSKEIYRDPISILLGIFMPVGLLILMAVIGKKAPLDIFKAVNLTPGICIFSYTFLMQFSAMLLCRDRQTALFSRMLTTPLGKTGLLMAYILPFLPLAALQFASCFLTGLFFGMPMPSRPLLLGLIQVLSALGCISLGLFIGSLFSENQIAGIGTLLINVIGVFSGVWIDLDLIGGVFKTVGFAMPWAHAVVASRQAYVSAAGGQFFTHLLVNLIFNIVFFGIGIIALRARTRRT